MPCPVDAEDCGWYDIAAANTLDPNRSEIGVVVGGQLSPDGNLSIGGRVYCLVPPSSQAPAPAKGESAPASDPKDPTPVEGQAVAGPPSGTSPDESDPGEGQAGV
ncbi:hypothetical protein BGX33_010096 [Mortierella sp. NVP41]|nr:hypothetical protein BGX33_010096 [Mortierella sp. NVP41]